MDDVKLNLDEKGQGAFFNMEGAEQLGEMVAGVAGKNLTVYHTEVSTKQKAKGWLKVTISHGRTSTKEWLTGNSALSLCSCAIQTSSRRLCRCLE
jgi:hypothetical protein